MHSADAKPTTMSAEIKTYWHDTKRCPKCLELGLRMQYGNIVCDKCDDRFTYSHFKIFNEAFDKGREYERTHAASICRGVYGNSSTAEHAIAEECARRIEAEMGKVGQ